MLEHETVCGINSFTDPVKIARPLAIIIGMVNSLRRLTTISAYLRNDVVGRKPPSA